MGIEFKFLQALQGDCILIKSRNFNILIDGGMSSTYRSLKKELNELDKVDLVILTHIDEDHILGLIKLFKDDEVKRKVKKVWFNSLAKLSELFTEKYNENMEISTDSETQDISPKQGESLEELLCDIDYELIYIEKQQKYFCGEIEITLLSPYKDNLKKLYEYWLKEQEIRGTKKKLSSKTNQSSIAFILKYNNKNYLFLGDAHIDIVTKSLQNLFVNRLKIDFVKISYHGSKNNTDQNFLDAIDTDRYIILTNGAETNNHPHNETLDLIINDAKNQNKEIEILLNYPEHVYGQRTFYSQKLDYKNFKVVFREEDNRDGIIYLPTKGKK
jgi:beta-lactamase superfamily II metal-dependent hydrolase